MHERCQCCSSCQDELQSLRHRFQSLLINYTCIRDRSQRQYTAHQIYLNENINLNRKMIEQKIEIQRQQTEIENSKVHALSVVIKRQGGEGEGEAQRKEITRIAELNKVIDSKNRELSQLKYQISLKKNQLIQMNVQNEGLRRKVGELNESLRINVDKTSINQEVNNRIIQPKQLSAIYSKQNNQSYEKLKLNNKIIAEDQWFVSPSSPLNISFPSTKSREPVLSNYIRKADPDKSISVQSKSFDFSIQSRIDKIQQQNDLLRNELSMRI